jgi:dolichyl-phosphate beta-glucosyltransferase
MEKFSISIVIPVYNESARLYNLQTVSKFLKTQKFKSEVIVVNDGSRDDTLKKLKVLQKRLKFKLVNYSPNRGKGFAIKSGVKEAKGDYILFMDVDLSTPLDQFKKFEPYLKEFDLVIGTRKDDSAHLIKRQPKLRESLGKVFTYLSQKSLNVNVSDFTCGFKCFSKRAAKEIFPIMTIERWGFDSEILFIAKKKGLSVKEVSVVWKNDPQTKVKFPQDIINSLKELYLIRMNDLQGVYN